MRHFLELAIAIDRENPERWDALIAELPEVAHDPVRAWLATSGSRGPRRVVAPRSAQNVEPAMRARGTCPA
jgi:hypothetical protein